MPTWDELYADPTAAPEEPSPTAPGAAPEEAA